MHHANNVKQEMTYDGRNRTTKPRKDQKARRKRNLKILGNIVSGHNETNRDKGKNSKRVSQGNLKPNYVAEISSKD